MDRSSTSLRSSSSRRRSSRLSGVGLVRAEGSMQEQPQEEQPAAGEVGAARRRRRRRTGTEARAPTSTSIEVERRDRPADAQDESQHSHRSDEEEDTADTDDGKQQGCRGPELPASQHASMCQLRAVWSASPWHQAREDPATRQQRVLKAVSGLANPGQLARQRSSALRRGSAPLGSEQRLAWVALNWLALSPGPSSDGTGPRLGRTASSSSTSSSKPAVMPTHAQRPVCASEAAGSHGQRSSPVAGCGRSELSLPSSLPTSLPPVPVARQRSASLMRRFAPGTSEETAGPSAPSEGECATMPWGSSRASSGGVAGGVAPSVRRGDDNQPTITGDNQPANMVSLRRASTACLSTASTSVGPAVQARMETYPKLPQVSFLSGVKHRGFGAFYLAYEMTSYAEPKLDRAIREEGAAMWRLHHQSQVRVRVIGLGLG